MLRHGSEAVVADSLWDAMASLSTHLREQSCRILAVLADNGPDWVMADLVALQSGLVHLPLPNFFSPSQMTHALNQAGADTVLTDQPVRIEALGLGFARIDQWRGLTLMGRDVASMDLPKGTAKISFTSGSTGSPKGVCLSAAGLLDTAQALVSALSSLSIQRHLAVLPLSLLLENVAGVYAPLLSGAEVVLPDLNDMGWRGMSGFDPVALAEVANTTQPGSVILVPELLKAWTLFLMTSGQSAPESLKFVAVGGARCDTGLLQMARTQGLPAFEGYGLTECGSVVSLNLPGADLPGSVGHPLSHVRIHTGVEGEIRVESRVFLGYLHDSTTPAAVWPTGDLGYLDENGFLHLSGRRKNLLITAFGRNVAPEWVEAALTAQPEIAQAVAVGEAKPWLSALLTPMPGADAAALERAVARANAELPDYARMRSWLPVAHFTLENGFATGNGRPRREAIAVHYAAAIESLYQNKESSHVIL